MSIYDAIKKLEEKELWAVTPSWDGEETPRYVYVSLEVAEFLWGAEDHEKRVATRARALVDHFVEGGHITLGWDPDDKGNCIMARVKSDDPEYEIWDFRLTPQPQVRILGAFVEKDTFMCVTWNYRDDFDWLKEIAHCIAEWKRLFDKETPFRRGSPHEYLSQPFEVV